MVLFKILIILMFINWTESQTFGQIEYDLGFDEKIFGSNFQIQVKLNTKPLGSTTNLQCLIQQFPTIDLYNQVYATINSSFCPINIYNGSQSISISANNFQKNSAITYDGVQFGFYFNDSSNNTALFKLDNYTFSDQTLNYIQIDRYPLNSLKVDYTFYLSLFCCDTSIFTKNSTNNSIYYHNAATRFIVTIPADLNPSLQLQLPISPTNNDLLNPTYKPCNCDLTLNICDLNCCCDPTCSSNDLQSFGIDCVTPRNVTSNEIDSYFCNDIYNNPKLTKPSWFPLLCIHSSFSVILGKFYSPLDLADPTSIQIQSLVDSTYNMKSKYLDANSTVTNSKFFQTSYNQNYANGVCIQRTFTTSETTPNEFVRIPQVTRSFSACTYDAPIRYLVDNGKSFCYFNTDAALNFCNNPSLSVNQYLLNGLVINNPSIDAKVNVVNEYWKCSFDYLFPTNSNNNNNLVCNGNNFSSTSQMFDTNLNGLCNSNTWTYSASRINNVPTDIYLNLDLTKCINMSSQPNDPTISNGKCNNAVVRVKNIFKWNNGTINTILTQIVYTDIAYNAILPASLPQLFETKWLYETSYTLTNVNTPTQYNNYISSSTNINSLRSGIKSYINGQPLITGHAMDLVNGPVNILYDQRISTYKGKLCGTNNAALERILINFNQNTSSNCVVQLNKNDLITNCNSLRRIIFNKLNDYFAPSNVISINGNPNMTVYNSTDWLRIYPTERSINDTINDTKNNANQCTNVPYKLSVNFFYSSNNNTITGAYITYMFRNWTFLCKTSNCDASLVQDFEIEFEANFINTYYPNFSWTQECQNNPGFSKSCLQQVFFTWPRDFTKLDYFYLYQVQLGLLFGVFSYIILYVLIVGLICPC